jgi:hypothetical protein
MKTEFKIQNDIIKCAGQDEKGNMICAYRTSCDRYMREPSKFQDWANYWKAGDDCPQYRTIPKN